jgi:hypothetical protein
MIFLLKKWCLGLIVFPYSSLIFAGPLKNDRLREHCTNERYPAAIWCGSVNWTELAYDRGHGTFLYTGG